MRIAALLLGAASLAACSMDPPLPQTPLPVPESWPVGDPYLLQSEAALPDLRYQDVFRDPRLLQLVDQALANNRDLAIAAANIAAARAQAVAVGERGGLLTQSVAKIWRYAHRVAAQTEVLFERQ